MRGAAVAGDAEGLTAGDWARLVHQPMTQKEVERIRTCIARNRPYGKGCEKWDLLRVISPKTLENRWS
jgi:hypothetical protein